MYNLYYRLQLPQQEKETEKTQNPPKVALAKPPKPPFAGFAGSSSEGIHENLPENAAIIYRTSACHFLLSNEKEAYEFYMSMPDVKASPRLGSIAEFRKWNGKIKKILEKLEDQEKVEFVLAQHTWEPQTQFLNVFKKKEARLK